MKWYWLVVIIVVFVLIGGVGWWWSRIQQHPFAFNALRFKIAAHWYLGEFQPVFLWQYSKDGNEYFKVMYQHQRKLRFGDVLVGTTNPGLSWLPYIENQQDVGTKAETIGYKYPFYPGQRLRITFLASTKADSAGALRQICTKAPRICELAPLVQTRLDVDKIDDVNLQTPNMPVMGVGVETTLINRIGN